jgi:hypothetical protein
MQAIAGCEFPVADLCLVQCVLIGECRTQEAVLLPCCSKAVCDACARKAIEQSGGSCGLCRTRCPSDKLRPMEAVRRQVKDYLTNKALAASSAIGDVKSESDLALQRALEAANTENPALLDGDDLLGDVVSGQAMEAAKKTLTPYEEYMQMFAAGKNDSDSDSDDGLQAVDAKKTVSNPAASPNSDPRAVPTSESPGFCVVVSSVRANQKQLHHTDLFSFLCSRLAIVAWLVD